MSFAQLLFIIEELKTLCVGVEKIPQSFVNDETKIKLNERMKILFDHLLVRQGFKKF